MAYSVQPRFHEKVRFSTGYISRTGSAIVMKFVLFCFFFVEDSYSTKKNKDFQNFISRNLKFGTSVLLHDVLLSTLKITDREGLEFTSSRC